MDRADKMGYHFRTVGVRCEVPHRNLNFAKDGTPRSGDLEQGSGDVAQLGEHHVRNVRVGGSNPPISTILFLLPNGCPVVTRSHIVSVFNAMHV